MKIVVAIGSRANYGSIRSVLLALHRSNSFSLHIVLFNSAVSDKHGKLDILLKADGLTVNAEFSSLMDEAGNGGMAKSTALAMLDFASFFANNPMDWLVIIGDRYEVMAPCLAAAYSNVRIAHTMGGEITGTLDESVRHALTKLAHLHFVATEESRKNVIRMGECPSHVVNVGCPRIDSVVEYLKVSSKNEMRQSSSFNGVGADFSIGEKDFVLVLYHPVTTNINEADLFFEFLEWTLGQSHRYFIFWPNADAGNTLIARRLRIFQQSLSGLEDSQYYFVKNVSPIDYYYLMSQASLIVGNSSSAIRDGAYIGIPAINIGDRQANREKGTNVIDVHTFDEFTSAYREQIRHGKYPSNHLYGSGKASVMIMDQLLKQKPSIQKTLNYAKGF